MLLRTHFALLLRSAADPRYQQLSSSNLAGASPLEDDTVTYRPHNTPLIAKPEPPSLCQSYRKPSIDRKRPFSIVHEQCRIHKRPFQALMLAADLLRTQKEITPLIWLCALEYYAKVCNSYVFQLTLLSWYKLPFPLRNIRFNAAILKCASTICLSNSSFFTELVRLNRAMAEQGGQVRLYAVMMQQLLQFDQHKHDTAAILDWHKKLLAGGFLPKEIERHRTVLFGTRRCDATILLSGFHADFKSHNLSVAMYDLVIPSLTIQKRYMDAQKMHDLIMLSGGQPTHSKSFEDLLSYHIKHSPDATTKQFVRDIRKVNLILSDSTRQLMAYYFGSAGNLSALSRLHRQLTKSEREIDSYDSFWAAALRGSQNSVGSQDRIIDLMISLKVPLGQESVNACFAAVTSLYGLRDIMRRVAKSGLELSPHGYASYIRQLAKSGDASKAKAVFKQFLEINKKYSAAVSPVDVELLQRNMMLGLLEGSRFQDLEDFHRNLVARDTATPSTWNLLIRARVTGGEMDGALQGLEEMRIQHLSAENATAHELMSAVLRRRQNGKNPDVASDRRRHLEDIKSAISIGHRCMRLGGRVQPETWREVLRRLGLAGELESLEKLTEWLIRQYSTTRPDDTSAEDDVVKLYKPIKTLRMLPPDNAQHPLRRLLRPSDINATIMRGYRANKPRFALQMVIKWRVMGVSVDKHDIEKRVRAGLRYIARHQSMGMTELRQLQDSLNELMLRL